MKPSLYLQRIIKTITVTLPLLLCLPAHANGPSSDNASTHGTGNNTPKNSHNINMPKENESRPKVDHRLFGSGKPLGGATREQHFRGPPVPHIPLRRGLAVIADFADSRFEDWQGAGFNNVGEVADQLHKMEEHWAWLSRGKERFQWDIIRITLPVNLTANAYPSWVDFRNAAGALIRQQVDISKYDGNHDGKIDSAWIIPANHGMEFDYLIGGTSSNAGVNNFVDVQNSGSIVAGSTGNFNHETGHTVGLSDLYGPFGTIVYLSVMADSHPVPSQDFTAYERTLLGWLKPRIIGQGNHHVHLSSADQHMDAVRISTSRPSEYFLIEYRRRPDSGFGSVAPPYNGLAVYHVLEDSNQSVDPPLLKLEPADGNITPDTPPELTDFLYPDNLSMKKPFVLRSYFGGEEVFRINNVQWVGAGGMAFDVQVAPPSAAQPNNLLANPSFEAGTNTFPDVWQPDAYNPSAVFKWETQFGKEGKRSASISAATPNDARWIQSVSGLTPGQGYLLCGWARGENIVTTTDAQIGANISVMGGFTHTESLSGTFDWKQACVTFRPEENNTTVACRLGFYGSTVTGKTWCDDMSVIPLRSAFN